MGRFRAMSIMHTTDGLPANFVTNTWSFGHPTFPDTTAVAADWETFMRAISGIFPDTVATSGHELKIYDLDETEPRVPVAEQFWSFSSTLSGATLPAECAICLSYRGVYSSGDNRARRRGRMFLGPLDGNTLTESGHIASSTTAGIVLAAQNLWSDLDEDGCVLSVYSRADDVLVPVVAGWVDNSYDTVRSRGPEPTARNAFTFGA